MNNLELHKILNIVFAVFYLIIGTLNIVYGADPSSRFYEIDQYIVLVLGILFVLTSIGVLFKQEMARILILAVLLLSMIEIFVTINIRPIVLSLEYLFVCYGYTLLLKVVYMPGIIFYLSPRTKQYFNQKRDLLVR